MAERSFAKEVEQLRIGAGEEFRGEGILAVTKALLQCGVGYVAGYQGAPISHLMDVLADASDIMEELGIRFEASASEAAAAATLAASVHYPIRGAVTFKSTVGTNVASDALANLASGGVRGGALIIVGEDYGEGSSIMQERSHAFAMKSQIWLLDPRPNLPSIVKAVEDGFELSEASNTPVMLEIRIRACHVHGRFIAKDNQRPAFTVADALETPSRDTNRIVLPPASFLHEQEKINVRLPAAIKFVKERKLNETFGPDGREDRHHPAGRHVQRPDPRARAGRACRRLRQHRRAALRPQRHLSADRRRGDRLLPRQGRRPRRRGGPARLHRAGAGEDPAQCRCRHPDRRQGAAADGRRVHGEGRSPTAWRRSCARTHAEPSPRSPARAEPAGRRRRRGPRRSCRSRCRCGRRASAPAARNGRSSRR